MCFLRFTVEEGHNSDAYLVAGFCVDVGALEQLLLLNRPVGQVLCRRKHISYKLAVAVHMVVHGRCCVELY